MRLHAWMECSLVNGPGRRVVVWMQGCELHCNGCWNQATHSQYAGTHTSSEELGARVLESRSRYHIEGLTFSGGEPIHQIRAMVDVLLLLKQVAPHLSAGLFSGYTERELDEGRFETYDLSDVRSRQTLWQNLRGLLDFAVLGRFNQHQPSLDPLVTSRNQRLHLLSARYSDRDFEDQMVEVAIDAEGLTQITGFPTLGTLT